MLNIMPVVALFACQPSDSSGYLLYLLSLTSLNRTGTLTLTGGCVSIQLCTVQYVFKHPTLTSVYFCTLQSVSVWYVPYSPSPCGRVYCAVHSSAATPRCHLLPFPIINSAFAVTSNYVLSHLRLPCPLTLQSLCLLQSGRPCDPDCLFTFPTTVIDRIHSLWSCPSIQHLSCVLLKGV